MNLVEVEDKQLSDSWSSCIGPPEPAGGPTGDCPECGGALVYGFECKRHICTSCWRVFKEEKE